MRYNDTIVVDQTKPEPKREPQISPKNKELLEAKGKTIAEIEELAKNNLPSSIPMGSGSDAPARKFADSTDQIKEFANDEDRHAYMDQLITDKKYSVGIKQKHRHKWLSMPSFGFLKRKEKPDTTRKEAREIAKRAKKEAEQTKKLSDIK